MKQSHKTDPGISRGIPYKPQSPQTAEEKGYLLEAVFEALAWATQRGYKDHHRACKSFCDLTGSRFQLWTGSMTPLFWEEGEYEAREGGEQ